MDWTSIFFNSWAEVARVAVVGVLAYAALLVVLRTSGKRTLSKLNAFDFVVTIALGSTLATVLLSKNVSLAEGVMALLVLVLLQFAMTWLSVRSERFQQLIKAEPTLLMRDGQFLDRAMKRQRVTREEILAVLRSSGIPTIEKVAAVVLETDGTMTTIRVKDGLQASPASMEAERDRVDVLATVERISPGTVGRHP